MTSTVRPHYRGATGISNWYAVLEILGILAVITNCLLIGFSFEALARLLDFDNFKVLAVIVCMEVMMMIINAIVIRKLFFFDHEFVIDQITFDLRSHSYHICDYDYLIFEL